MIVFTFILLLNYLEHSNWSVAQSVRRRCYTRIINLQIISFVKVRIPWIVTQRIKQYWVNGLYFVLMEVFEIKRFSCVKLETLVLLHKELLIFIFIFFSFTFFPIKLVILTFSSVVAFQPTDTTFFGFPNVLHKLRRLVKCISK